MQICIIALLILSIYALWRFGKYRSALAKFVSSMPPPNQLSWTLPNALKPTTLSFLSKVAGETEGDSHGSSELNVTVGPLERGTDAIPDFLGDTGIWAAAADSALAGSFVAHAALNIDPHVLNAIQFSTADHLHRLADIDNYVHDHFFAVPIHSADGWFERLTGYVAEQNAASYFEQAGHHVVFAPVANQPVWDMLVDGHPVQIKEGMAGAKEFIANHHGVDVFTGHDVAAAIKDPAVHGLDVLNKDAIHLASHRAIDNIHGVMHPGFHFPYITVALSSWREAKLLWNEKTTFDRAFRNVGMDVVGVGGGALAGAKGGAFVGVVIGGPVGAAIGGFVGAILGGVSGKMLSTTIRYIPFSNAKDEYNNAIASAQLNVQTEIDRSKNRVEELQVEYQRYYLEARRRIQSAAMQEIVIVAKAFEQNLLQLCEKFPVFLDDLLRQLDGEEQQVLSRVPSSGILGVLFPSNNDLYRGSIRTWFKRARKLIHVEVTVYRNIESRTVETLHAEVQRFLKAYDFQLDSMAKELARVAQDCETARQSATQIQDRALRLAESKRSELIQKIGKQVTSLQEQILAEITKWNVIIGGKRDVLKTEAGAVGLEL